MEEPIDLIVNLAPMGMIPTKGLTSHVPVSVNEVVEDVHEAWEIGISMVHLHARDERTGEPTYRAEVYGDMIAGIRRFAPDLVVCVSLSGRTFQEFEVWPYRLPAPGEPLSEYLLCQRTTGEGLVHIDTILTAKGLLERVPFRPQPRHSDLDWVLRIAAYEGIRVEFVLESEPLAIWHVEEGRRRIGTQPDWRYSLDWIRSNRDLVTPRAYGSFVLTWICSKAAQVGDWQAAPVLLKEARRFGQVTFADGARFLGIWLIPRHVRRWIGTGSGRRWAALAKEPGTKGA